MRALLSLLILFIGGNAFAFAMQLGITPQHSEGKTQVSFASPQRGPYCDPNNITICYCQYDIAYPKFFSRDNSDNDRIAQMTNVVEAYTNMANYCNTENNVGSVKITYNVLYNNNGRTSVHYNRVLYKQDNSMLITDDVQNFSVASAGNNVSLLDVINPMRYNDFNVYIYNQLRVQLNILFGYKALNMLGNVSDFNILSDNSKFAHYFYYTPFTIKVGIFGTSVGGKIIEIEVPKTYLNLLKY